MLSVVGPFVGMFRQATAIFCCNKQQKSESFRQHYTQFDSETVENARFSSSCVTREVDIALSSGKGGKDRQTSLNKRGRHQGWYTDLLPLQLQRLWRLLLSQVARIGLYPTPRRMQWCSKRSFTTSFLTKLNFFGWAFEPARFQRRHAGDAHG